MKILNSESRIKFILNIYNPIIDLTCNIYNKNLSHIIVFYLHYYNFNVIFIYRDILK